uniref:Uncharacterized protein n=1 Tax=Rhizophora mucronata TaxID=61149 RepID=A0A2P2Q7A9_RHIMU
MGNFATKCSYNRINFRVKTHSMKILTFAQLK